MRIRLSPILPLGLLTLLALLAVSLLGPANRASAQGVVATPPALITATPTSVNRGGLVTVSGANFAPNEPVAIYFAITHTVLITATANASGLLPPTGVTVPFALSAGVHRLIARGSVSHKVAQLMLTVLNNKPTVTVGSATVKPGDSVSVSGQGYAPNEQMTLALNGAALKTTPTVITTTAEGSFTAAFTVPTRLLDGSNTVSAVGNVSRVAAIAALNGTLPVATQFYFAGGLNTTTEHSFVDLVNTHAQPTDVTLTFYFNNGTTGEQHFTLAPRSRSTISVADYNYPVGTFGLALQGNRSISAQITVTRDGKDGDSLQGNTGLGTRWYLAEGYTGLTFHETVSILNPAQTAANVQLQILPLGGGAVRTVSVTAPAHSNLVTDINALVHASSVSIVAVSDLPVVVERTLTFSTNGYGLTMSAGSNTPATSWIFAEGTSVNHFETFLTILNPNTVPTQFTASFYDQNGNALGNKTLTLPGLSRTNLKLNDFLSASGIASVVTSNLPVVVERPEYFGSPNGANIAGSDVFGQNGAAVHASFPGGDTQGNNEFLLVYNPSAATVPITVTFVGTKQTVMVKHIDVPPTARYTINVNTFVPGFDATHGVTLQASGGLGFVAEQTVFAPNYSYLRSTSGLAQ